METLVVGGFGLQLKVHHGALIVAQPVKVDGKRTMEQTVYFRGRCEWDRLIIMGHVGTISLDAVGWLMDMEIEVLVIGYDGRLITQFGPTRRATVELKLLQIDALQTGHAVPWVRWLLRRKIQGHQRIMNIPELGQALTRLMTAESIDDCRMIEAHAAHSYWTSLTGLPVTFAKRDLKKVPDHWKRIQNRNTGLRTNRMATDPVNGLLNYGYAILEAETRIAAYVVGWDVDLGILHTSMEYRQSFVFDLMEPLRAQVDGWVFDYIEKTTFRRNDFVELPSGEVRLSPEVAKSFSMGICEALRPLCLAVAQEARYVLHELMGVSTQIS
ncbi:CRISPR-associated endonuclease Cas1 [Alicyclobacillus tolerans]|uniref:CRISPR-associated endonuclease Cas1 n=1 Tax=Alicyclobacillus tolerans TaxID=90970 RepID=UPI001EFFDD52|nr:CRISPR-associated endonuclease Cas1 [Alicyclobacillus tolerans]MCF8566996.1 CRISPR-associated endonuclease Cas1 [Alicyclobacillus tolerans]